MRILCLGPLWRGSNAGGLFRAMSRAGAFIEVIDEFYYVSLRTEDKKSKVAAKLIRSLQTADFNAAIRKTILTFRPDVLLVYKGAFVLPDTLHFARANGCRPVLFYPDVSTTTHGPHIPACIPIYDMVYTTKTFGITDMRVKYGARNAEFIPHGFDPDIHRPFAHIGSNERQIFGCDASFIGTWSPKKEKWLAYVMEHMPSLHLKIWGDQWNKATAPAIQSSIQGKPITGDLYALAIQCSTINLGILSEKVSGASSGDLITSRTFHITGASGFMLHERNEESVLYYREEEEAGFFDGPEELTKQIAHYLAHTADRERIRLAGHRRALADHSLDVRAAFIINHLNTHAHG